MPARRATDDLVKVWWTESLTWQLWSRNLRLGKHLRGARLLLQAKESRALQALAGSTGLRHLTLHHRSRHGHRVHLIEAQWRRSLCSKRLSVLPMLLILPQLCLQLHLYQLWHLELEVFLHLLLDLHVHSLLNLCLQLGQNLCLHLLVDDGLLVLCLFAHLLPNHVLSHLAYLLVEELEPGEAVLVLRLHGFPSLLFLGQLLTKSHVHLLQLLLKA